MGRGRRLLLVGVAATGLLAAAASCSPLYVLRAGWEEARILTARRPIEDVIVDPDTDDRTRGKLTFARLARTFAIEELGLDVGDSYTTYTRLDRDTLAMVLSAAEKDRLAARTWWFPVVGRVPYRGFFGPGRRPGRTAQAGRGGIRHLAAPHVRLQHPGMVRGPADVHGAAPGRDRGGPDPPARSLAYPPLGARERQLQRELRDFRGRCRRGRFLLCRFGRDPDRALHTRAPTVGAMR